MNLLFARYNFKEGSHAYRELRCLATEALKRGHRVTLFTGPNMPKGDDLPDGLEICSEKGSRNHFEVKYRELLKSGKFDRDIALEPLGGAQFCVPDMLRLFPAKPETRPDIFDTEYRRRWLREQEVFRTPSQTGIFCSGEIQRLTLNLCYGVVPGRIYSVSPVLDDMRTEGPDATEVKLLRKSHACDADDAILIVTFAEDWQAAGVDRALSSLAFMPEEWRKRVQYLVVGGNRPNGLEELQKEAAEINFPASQLQYLPDFRQPRLLLYGADLLLQPAREDFSGDLLADALACGLPVLCTASCGLSPFVQATGCSVINDPFDEEILQEALAFCLPKLGLIRQMLTNRAAMHLNATRSQAILDQMEKGLALKTPQLPPETAQALVKKHITQVEQGCAMKMDQKRNISRVKCSDGTTRIVKEYKRIHFWDGKRHIRRALYGTSLMQFFTPQCQAVIHEGKSDYLIFGDCGKGNFFTEEYLTLPNIKQLYTACGTLLAHLHTAGIYHMDCKPANFVRNTDATQECPYPICLIDCDNVRILPIPLARKKRIHNLAQFVAGTGNLARHDTRTWIRLVRAFQDGYMRHALLSAQEWTEFWNDFWAFMAEAKHVEYTLPFSCIGNDLKNIRLSLH